MKKLLLLSSFAFGLFTFSLAQQYGWQILNPESIPGTPDFSDVFFVSDDEGWITSSSIAEIYHTTDGGATFEIQETSLGTATEAIYMIDENEGYTGGGSGFVYRTLDGGTNWNLLGAISSTLAELDFANSTQGYACGEGAVFSITPVGVENLNCGQPTFFSGISSPSENNVWLCGGNDIMYYNGSTFEFQAGPAGTYNAICFVNDDHGWVVGTAGLIGHTENQGEDWHRQTNPDPDLHSLYDLFFLDENKGWAVGSQGTIIHTIDGGETWELQAQGLTSNFLRCVHFTSPNNGYIVGNGKTLLKYGELTRTNEVAETLQFEIYPNPAGKRFGVRSLEIGVNGGTIEIYDLNGRKLLEKQIPAGNETVEIDVSGLKSGVYFCRLNTENKSVTKKIIIQ